MAGARRACKTTAIATQQSRFAIVRLSQRAFLARIRALAIGHAFGRRNASVRIIDICRGGIASFDTRAFYAT